MTGVIAHNPMGQTVVERSNHALKEMLTKQKGVNNNNNKTQRKITQCFINCKLFLMLMNKKKKKTQQLLIDIVLWKKLLNHASLFI